MLLFYQES